MVKWHNRMLTMKDKHNKLSPAKHFGKESSNLISHINIENLPNLPFNPL